MSITYSLFYLLALWSLILGVASGFVYEFFRLLHRLHPRATWLIFLEDLLFCLFVTCGLLLLFFNLSYGRMRLYAFVFTGLGFLSWYFTVGKLFRKTVSRVLRYARPRVRHFRAWGYTHIQVIRFAHAAKQGFGSASFLRRKQDA